jgi:hypothetical protein
MCGGAAGEVLSDARSHVVDASSGGRWAFVDRGSLDLTPLRPELKWEWIYLLAKARRLRDATATLSHSQAVSSSTTAATS